MPHVPGWYWLAGTVVGALLLLTRSGRDGLRHERNACTRRTKMKSTPTVVLLAVLAAVVWPMLLVQGALVLLFRVFAAVIRRLPLAAERGAGAPEHPTDSLGHRMGKSKKKGREARLSRKRENKNRRENGGRRQRARQEAIAAQSRAAAARSTEEDSRAWFIEQGAEPLSEDLIRELTGERGWEEAYLREAAASGALYLRPENSLVFPDGAPPVSWSDDPGLRSGEYAAQGINPRLVLPWNELPSDHRERALAEARAFGREALEEEYEDLLESGELDFDATADYTLGLIDDGLHPHDLAYWRRKRKSADPRATAFLEGWRERRAEIGQERGAEGAHAATEP